MREVLSRITQLPPNQRQLALQQLVLLSGLRGLDQFVQKEAQDMPIEINLLDNVILAPAVKQGMRDGRLSIVRRMLNHRFGPLPEWVEPRLNALSNEQLEELSERLFDVTRLEDVFELQ